MKQTLQDSAIRLVQSSNAEIGQGSATQPPQDSSIRLVQSSDTEALLKIYEQYIDTPITFEYVLPSATEFQNRIQHIFCDYPYLVYEEDGQALGYAYAHRHMERAAYQWNVEAAIYLEKSICHKGIGTRLYRALFALLRLQGVRTVFSCVTLPNAASEGLHHSLGFAEAGIWRKSGYKGGRWHDVIWYELSLLSQEDGDDPLPPCSVHDLAPGLVQRILENA